jgi:photosystem II stability/assembly factor-like uncharacterized protein
MMMAAVLWVSTRKGLLRWEQHRGTWELAQTSFLGQNVTLALPDPRDGAIYAALNLGHFGVKLHRSRDAGATWEELAVPLYPVGEELVTGDGKPSVPANLKMIWSLEAGAASQPGRLWCGTLPGGLFRSDNGGASWQLMRGLWDQPERLKWFGGGYDTPGIHSICVDPRNPRRVQVGVSCGGVWTSDDDGTTWRCTATGMFAEYMPPELRGEPSIQDPHRLVQCPAAPETLWVQHHNGVFRSSDGAESWQEIPHVPPSVFGFTVAVHPRDPNTAWFVPAVKDETRVPVGACLVVARTSDGGKSFRELTNGLPSQNCFDLVYRHALDIDVSGEYLAMGSTTGNCWITADGGERWQQLSSNLPPIHAVRFA